MNRICQLKQTLIQNILDNQEYTNLEFIVLDYNSQDEMEIWFKLNINDYINAGRVIYYKTNEPLSFNHSHSKNLAFKLATGDVVCNINADHFTGKNFAWYVNHQYQIDNNIVITPINSLSSDGNKLPKDVLGKVCVKKDDFLKVKGFDERMRTYGFEDFDFINRLEMNNVRRLLLDNDQYLKYLPHADDERFSIEEIYLNLEKILVRYITPSISDVLFIYDTGIFEMGRIIDNTTVKSNYYKSSYLKPSYKFEYIVEDINWIKGDWVNLNTNEFVFFQFHTGEQLKLKLKDQFYEEVLQNEPSFFHILKDVNIKKELLEFHYLYKNRSLLEQNLLKKNICPNVGGFGVATVYKNFNKKEPIIIN